MYTFIPSDAFAGMDNSTGKLYAHSIIEKLNMTAQGRFHMAEREDGTLWTGGGFNYAYGKKISKGVVAIYVRGYGVFGDTLAGWAEWQGDAPAHVQCPKCGQGYLYPMTAGLVCRHDKTVVAWRKASDRLVKAWADEMEPNL